MKRMQDVAAQTMAIDAVTVSVVKALRERDIEPILLKGPSFASWLYGDGIPRPYNDTDLLIDSGVADSADAILTGLGYEALPNPPGPRPAATTWLKRGAAGSVDLHTGIWLFYETADAWRRLQAHTQPFLLDDLRVTVLDDVAKTVHVVTHALQGQFKEAGRNADLERAIQLVPEDTWRSAAALAAELGANDAFAVGLSGLAPGRALARRIGVVPSRSIPLRVRLLAEGEAESGASALDDLYRLAGWRTRAVYVARKLFPSADYVALTGHHSSRPIVNYARYWRRILLKAPHALHVWHADRLHGRDN